VDIYKFVYINKLSLHIILIRVRFKELTEIDTLLNPTLQLKIQSQNSSLSGLAIISQRYLSLFSPIRGECKAFI